MTGGSTTLLLYVVTAALALMPSAGSAGWVSLTAPCFGWMALERLLCREPFEAGAHSFLAGLFLAGCAASLAVGLWSGAAGSIAADEALLLLRFCFWAGVFLLTADLLSRSAWTPRLAVWAALAAVALALMRLADGLSGASLQAEGRWLSQNAYGARFSLFSPFLAAAALGAPGGAWLPWSGALLGVLAVVLVNGSRTAWFTALLGVGLVVLIHGLAGRLRAFALVGVTTALVGCIALPFAGPRPLRAGLLQQIESLGRLEQDKPVRTRQLIARKGLKMFAAEPWTGRGLGRFSKTEVAVVTADEAWLTDRDLNQRSAHNGYIKALAETGILGFLPLAALLGFLALKGLPAAVRLTSIGEPWAAGAYGSFAAVGLHLWTLSGLTGTAPWFCFGWTAAAILRARRVAR